MSIQGLKKRVEVCLLTLLENNSLQSLQTLPHTLSLEGTTDLFKNLNYYFASHNKSRSLISGFIMASSRDNR